MDFLHIDGKYNKAFQNYSSALQLFILLMICISAVKTLIKPKVDEMLLIKGVVFAAFLFFILRAKAAWAESTMPISVFRTSRRPIASRSTRRAS